jgi:hypothetical protein
LRRRRLRLLSAQKRDYHPLLPFLSSALHKFFCRRLTGEASFRIHGQHTLADQAEPVRTLEKRKPLRLQGLRFGIGSLTMSYFHTGIRTIIGAESFHCPVRDGKEWDQLAMVIRLKTFLACELVGLHASQFAESGNQRILIARSQKITRRARTYRYNVLCMKMHTNGSERCCCVLRRNANRSKL